jgi:2-C-methyl-D-erythritol 4-phosphate cytidylyltransferase
MMEFAVILPAAGSGSRFGGAHNKLVEPLCGVPVIAHTLAAFLKRPDVALVIIAANDDSDVALEKDPQWLRLLSDRRVRRTPGGATRAHSVRNAMNHVPETMMWVAVHDAARPLVSDAVIDRTLEMARLHGAAVPATAVTLTIKQAVGPLPARVVRTVPRHELWGMQTPQIMRAAALRRAFDTCPIPLEQVTDDVQLIELAGGEVYLSEGDERNLKITTPMDLKIAELILRERRT